MYSSVALLGWCMVVAKKRSALKKVFSGVGDSNTSAKMSSIRF
jgi:hypothetical protein